MTENPFDNNNKGPIFLKSKTISSKCWTISIFISFTDFAPNEKTFKWFVVDNNKTIVQIFERFFLLSYSFFSLNCVYFAE